MVGDARGQAGNGFADTGNRYTGNRALIGGYRGAVSGGQTVLKGHGGTLVLGFNQAI